MCIAVPTLFCKPACHGDALSVEPISLMLYDIYIPIVTYPPTALSFCLGSEVSGAPNRSVWFSEMVSSFQMCLSCYIQFRFFLSYPLFLYVFHYRTLSISPNLLRVDLFVFLLFCLPYLLCVRETSASPNHTLRNGTVKH